MNATSHYDAESWLAYASAALDAGERQSMMDHAAHCRSCAAMRQSSIELVSSFRDPRTWSESDSGAAPRDSVLDRLRFAAIEHERSRNSAAASTAALLELPDDDLVRALADPQRASSALVVELVTHARQAVHRDPRRAFFLADLAVTLSRRVPDSPECLHARGVALKELGNALRFLGRLPESLAAYEESREHFLSSRISAIDVAQVDLGRAMVLRETGDLTEASALARQSATTFLEFGDARRWLHARLLAGAIAFSLGQVDQARDIFLELLQTAQEQHDLDSLSRLFNNLGRCYVELGDSDTAATYLLQAIATFRELGLQTEEIRTRWSLARMLLHAGKPLDAAERLGEVAADFGARGMLFESALASLDRIEALLVLGRTNEVPPLVESVLARFMSAGAHPAAETALAYLHEAARTGEVPREKLSHVRRFLERLPEEPALLFLPLPD